MSQRKKGRGSLPSAGGGDDDDDARPGPSGIESGGRHGPGGPGGPGGRGARGPRPVWEDDDVMEAAGWAEPGPSTSAAATFPPAAAAAAAAAAPAAPATPRRAPATGRAAAAAAKRSEAQVQQKVNELVQFLLVKDQKKVPIRRADMVKTILQDYKDLASAIIERAGQTLEEVFGLQLKEIDPRHHAYIIVNKLERLDGDDGLRDDQTVAKMGLLMVILSLVFMKGNSAKEALVWDVLRKLRVDPEKRHGTFGDVRKLVKDEFVRQKYLEYNRVPHTDPPEYEFLWGPRAYHETSKMQVLRFVAKIQNREPSSWVSQYNEALQEELAAAAASAPAASASASAASTSAASTSAAASAAAASTSAAAGPSSSGN